MFITKKKANEIFQQGYEGGWKAAASDYEREFHLSADRVALEASRHGPPNKPAQTYKDTYEAVYRHLVQEHGSRTPVAW
ncbi:hypothetical protein LCGC14_1020850 [marine sediment metagenome]|uniref:Uncharacterized protein n=1 Tax=marine sediment metagenome TaxID=412755 RepID=A0A0F9NIZ1_9ZZZZ